MTGSLASPPSQFSSGVDHTGRSTHSPLPWRPPSAHPQELSPTPQHATGAQLTVAVGDELVPADNNSPASIPAHSPLQHLGVSRGGHAGSTLSAVRDAAGANNRSQKPTSTKPGRHKQPQLASKRAANQLQRHRLRPERSTTATSRGAAAKRTASPEATARLSLPKSPAPKLAKSPGATKSAFGRTLPAGAWSPDAKAQKPALHHVQASTHDRVGMHHASKEADEYAGRTNPPTVWHVDSDDDDFVSQQQLGSPGATSAQANLASITGTLTAIQQDMAARTRAIFTAGADALHPTSAAIWPHEHTNNIGQPLGLHGSLHSYAHPADGDHSQVAMQLPLPLLGQQPLPQLSQQPQQQAWQHQQVQSVVEHGLLQEHRGIQQQVDGCLTHLSSLTNALHHAARPNLAAVMAYPPPQSSATAATCHGPVLQGAATDAELSNAQTSEDKAVPVKDMGLSVATDSHDIDDVLNKVPSGQTATNKKPPQPQPCIQLSASGISVGRLVAAVADVQTPQQPSQQQQQQDGISNASGVIHERDVWPELVDSVPGGALSVMEPTGMSATTICAARQQAAAPSHTPQAVINRSTLPPSLSSAAAVIAGSAGMAWHVSGQPRKAVLGPASNVSGQWPLQGVAASHSGTVDSWAVEDGNVASRPGSIPLTTYVSTYRYGMYRHVHPSPHGLYAAVVLLNCTTPPVCCVSVVVACRLVVLWC